MEGSDARRGEGGLNAPIARAIGRPRTVVVGAGLAGLAVARELASRGVSVTVLDVNPEVGGLARTFRYGGWSFDVGPHRLRPDGEGVRRIVTDALGGNALSAPDQPGFHAFGRTHPLPLRGSALRALPVRAMLHGAWDLVRRERVKDDSYESEIVSAYGRTLYERLFRPASERFLGTPAERLDGEWARAGLANAQREASGGAIYPRLGMGVLAERLADDTIARGGRILLEHEVTGVEVAGNRVVSVEANGERFGADAFVWTAPVTLALRLLGALATGLHYVSTVLFNVALREPSTLGHPWVCYADERFMRVSDPTAFSPDAAPEGRGALCVECNCRKGDALWDDPSKFVPSILVGLALTGAMRSVRSVEAVCPERVPDSFPIYERGYREELRGAMSSLVRYRNLVLAGRGGLFWYNRMDESIAHGLRVAARVEEEIGQAGGTPREAANRRGVNP